MVRRTIYARVDRRLGKHLPQSLAIRREPLGLTLLWLGLYRQGKRAGNVCF